MPPELFVAAEARRHGWNRWEIQLQLLVHCPTWTVAEVEREVAKIIGTGRDSHLIPEWTERERLACESTIS
jgi:hypothetical protein